MIDCALNLPCAPSFLPCNPFHVREFRVFRRRRLKNQHHHRAFAIRSQLNPFETLFHNLVSQVTSVNSLELIAPALGLSSGVALYLSNAVSAKNSMVSDMGEWILLSSPTPFNRFVFLRCPSITFPGSELVEDVSEKLVKQERHFVRLHSGRIRAITATADDSLEHKLTYQRLCISTEDGGVISLDWPSNLNLREEHGLDTTLLLVPGTPEGSMDRNVRFSVIEALRRGLFPVVMNPRGCAGSPLTTARLFSAADSDDIYTAVQFISNARPWTTLMAIGWGYGANMLTKYLAEVGERTPLTAATCIDNPFDLEEATQTPPYHMAIDQDLTGGLINILRSNKELFQGKTKGFDVEKALKAKSVRDFEKLISSVSHGFKSIEEYYSKSSTRSVVGNVKIPVLYIQNDNGSAPMFSIPRNLIAENPFTSLLLCSYSPPSVIASMQPVLSWCQKLSIEWLTAVELGLLKGRHPLLKDVDIAISSSRGLALEEGRTAEERGKVIRQLDYNWSNASSGYYSTSFSKKLEESQSSGRTHLRSQNYTQRKSQLEDNRSLEIEFGVLHRTGSFVADMGKEDEVSLEHTEKGQALRTAEVVMNMLEITNPGTLTEEEKKKVLNAVDKGETLMKALQDAVPEEVCGKLMTAVSEILHAQGSNLKFKDLVGTSHKSNTTLDLKEKTEKKVKDVSDAEDSSQIATLLHQMGDINDVSDGSDSYQPNKDKFTGELESKPSSSDKLQKPIDQDGSQSVGMHGDHTSAIRKETSDSSNPDSSDGFSKENTAQYLDNSEKGLDISAKPKFPSKDEQTSSHVGAIGNNYEDQGGGIAQLDDKEKNKPNKNEEKAADPSNDNKVASSFKMEEALSSRGSTSEAQPVEPEYNQKDDKNLQPGVENTKPVISESNVNNFSVSQALDALAGIDDSTQVAVNSVFNVIENMISQLEGSENDGDDKTDSSLGNRCSDNDMPLEKKERGNRDSSVKPERPSGPCINNILERKGDSEHGVTSGWEEDEFTPDSVFSNGNYLIRSQPAALAGKDVNGKDKLLHDLDGNADINKIPLYLTSNVYFDSVHNNFFLKNVASNMPTRSLDMDTTTDLLLDYIPEEGQWKFIEQPESKDAISICEGIDGQVHAYAHAKVRNTDDAIEPLYIILDAENKPEPVGEYQTKVNEKEEIDGNEGSKDLEYLVRTIVMDSLQVEVGRRLSAANKELQLGVNRDIEHVANVLSVAVGYDSGRRCKNDGITSDADKMGTLCGEQIITSISSAVQETVYLKKILPLGVIVGSSLAALRKSFHVTTLHDDNQGECLAVDQAKKSGERNRGEVNNGGEPSQNVMTTNKVCGEGEETRNLNEGTVVVGAVTAALGASALLINQQDSCKADKTTESSLKSKDKTSLQKEPERLEPENNPSIVTALAEKAMSVVPTKEDGEVDQERLVAMLADLGQKGGILKLVGRIALLWGGLHSAMNLTDKLISFLRIAERPLFQRILGSVVMVLVLWSPITLPLLPTLVSSWTTKTPSRSANFACLSGLYIAAAILVMLWGKRIREYKNPAKEYGLDYTSRSKIHSFVLAFFGGVAVLLGIQFVNRFLGYTTLSWPPISPLVNLVSWLKLFAKSLLVVVLGIVSSIFVAAVEELLFRSWLTEEIALDLGYYPGVIISGLAFAISQRSVQAIPVLWVLSLGLAGARQRSEGCLSIPIGLRAGIMACSFILKHGGLITYKPSIPMHHPVWIMGIDAQQPLSGVAGFAFSLFLASIFFPTNNPGDRNNFKRPIQE